MRLTTTGGFGSLWLTEHIGEFIDLYSDIAVSLLVADIELDLTMREADVAIRVKPPTQPDLVQRRLFTGHLGIYAAPSYLNRFGTPMSMKALTKHRVISFGSEMPSPFAGHNWLVDELCTITSDFEPSLTVNNVYGMLRCVQNGIGVATLPTFLSNQQANLVRI